MFFALLVRVTLSVRYTVKGHVPSLDSFNPAEFISFVFWAERRHSTSTIKL
jgi:hypothetical protein